MLVGSATSYVTPSAWALAGRAVSPTTPADFARATPAPIAAGQADAGSGQSSSHKETDRPADGPPRNPREPGGRTESRQSEQAADLREQQVVGELAARDREVRTHEQAHAAIGGGFAGAPSYSFTRGPDGKSYAVGGEVGIDTSPVAGDPAATLRKMAVVQRAALAPAEPSAQDLQVAAQAQASAIVARAELAELPSAADAAVGPAELNGKTTTAETADNGDKAARIELDPEQTATARQSQPSAQAVNAALDMYRRLAESPAPAPQVDLHA
ncbi:MAG: putative metalloprotease CJM1_0395 family protein [Pseudomonas sp.]